MNNESWNFDDKPTTAGWYAIAYCWEPMEGTFFGADRWDGAKWEDRWPIVGHHGPFDSEDEAAAWADKHDYD